MIEEKDLVDRIQEAKDIIGDDAIPIIAEHLGITVEDGRASCPFHQDDTPSFIWNPKTKYFKCFSCSRVYSILDYFVDITGSTKEAINELFKMAHMEYDAYSYKPFEGDRIDWFKDYKYPHPEKEPTEDGVIKYFGYRGISKETLEYAGVKEDAHGNVAFEYRDLDDKLLCVKYRLARKVHKGENKMWFQKDASTVPILWNVKKLDFTKPLIISEGECFRGDAEILTPNGWVRFDEYNNEPVMQYNEDGTGQFIVPMAYIKHEYDGELWEIAKAGNYYSCTTPNHGIVYRKPNNQVVKKKLSEMPNTVQGSIPRVLEYSGSGLDLTDDEIRLQVAFSADGSFNKIYCYKKNDVHRIRFAFSKKRKVDRIKNILDSIGINYTYTDNENRNNRYYVGFTDEKKFLTKEFNWDWLYKMNLHQKQVFIAEVEHWDGYRFKTRNQSEFYTAVKHNADFVQAVCHTSGIMSTIKTRDYLNGTNVCHRHCITYTVSILHSKKTTSWQYMHKNINKIPYNGYVYCVQVPSGMILVRDKNKITVTGNCDTLSIIEAGYTNVCSVPNGAGSINWIEFNYDFLQNFDKYVLYFDNDTAGQEGLNKVISRLGEYKCKIVKPTVEDENRVEEYYSSHGREGIRKTDANNILLACGKERVIDLINRAEEVPVKNLKYLMDCENQDLKDIEKTSTGLDGLDKILYGNLKGCLTIYTGLAGSGKSSLCNLTSVIAPIEAGKKVFIFSGELSEGQLLNWIMSPLAGINNTVVWDNNGGRKGFSVTTEAEQAIRQYYHDDIILYSDVNELETNEDSLLQAMEIAYRKYNCEYFLIDNLMSISFDNTSDSIYENQKKYFIKLMNFVNQYQVTVSCIVHPRKSQNGDNKLDVYSLNGSSNLSNLCHRLIAVSRLHDDEEGYSMEVEIIKDRPSQSAGQKCKLMYDYCTRRIYSTNDELKHEFNWELNFNHNYSDRVKDNLIINRRDVLDTIPKINTFNPDTDCDQY